MKPFSRNVSFVLLLCYKLHLFENLGIQNYLKRVLHPFKECSLKARIFESTTASIEAFYCNAKSHFLKGMHCHFQDMRHSFQWNIAKGHFLNLLLLQTSTVYRKTTLLLKYVKVVLCSFKGASQMFVDLFQEVLQLSQTCSK